MAYDKQYYQDKKIKLAQKLRNKKSTIIQDMVRLLNDYLADEREIIGEINEINKNESENETENESKEGKNKDIQNGGKKVSKEGKEIGRAHV